MLDVSLLKDPVFMLIGISNVFGMAGLYVPFVYLVDAASLNVSLFKFIFEKCRFKIDKKLINILNFINFQ